MRFIARGWPIYLAVLVAVGVGSPSWFGLFGSGL